MPITGCIHDDRFFMMSTHSNERPEYVFACSHRCGFWLNFDPRAAGLHRTHKWVKFVVSFTCEPVATKPAPFSNFVYKGY